MGSSHEQELIAAVMHFTREIAMAIHPLATQARCDHVDCTLGSSSMTWWRLVDVGGSGGEGGGVVSCGNGSMTSWFFDFGGGGC